MRERKHSVASKETPARVAATTHAPRTHTRRVAPPHRDAIAPFTITPKPDPRGGVPLDAPVRRSEEARAGADFRPVRVHQDASSARAAEARNARAFTAGEHVYAGRNAPDLQRTHEGRSILRHELQHVLEVRRDPMLRDAVLRLPEDQVILQMEQRVTANDVPGALQVLRSENGLHAASAAVRGAISNFLTRGQFTLAQAWRAVGLQIHGTEVAWPVTTRNFVDGVESGVFTPPAGMPPSTGPELQQIAMQTSTALTASVSDFDRYRTLFDSRWHLPRFAGATMSPEFDPSLDSRGPRNRKARAIFDEILAADAGLRTAYLIGGIVRRLIDAYIGPENMNPEASPRVELVRRMLGGPAIAAAAVSDPAYVTFRASVTAVAQNLESPDRQVIDRSHDWQLLIDNKVTTAALRTDLRSAIRNAWTSRPAPSTSGPAPVTPPPPVAPPLTLTADQQTFVNNLALSVPATPITSRTETQLLTFNPASSRDPAGLTVRSRVETSPPGQVRERGETEHPWPTSAPAGAAHQPLIEVGGVPGHTDFTGSLTVVPSSGTITQTPRTATVRVQDDRRAAFIANVRHGLIFSDQNSRFFWTTSSTVRYYGGFVQLQVRPRLVSGVNPGLEVWADATILRSGTPLHYIPRTPFGRRDSELNLGGVLVLAGTPPRTTPDPMELRVRFFPSNNPVPSFHDLTQAFSILPGTTFTDATVLAQLNADYHQLNATGSGSYLAQMRNATAMGARAAQAARIADSIQHRNVEVEPFLIRPDSIAWLLARSFSPALVAYVIGHTAIDDAHTKADRPGADAWRFPSHPRALFINLTPSLASPATKRPDAFVIDFMIHEAVHALDFPRTAVTNLDRYKTEFRAYWMGGQHDLDPVTHLPLSTAYDPSMDNLGPKSRKARAIFRHLYRNPLYSYVQPDYDANTAHFREQVNEFLYPDGVNIIVSRHLDNLRTEIESYTGAGFTAHRGRVATRFGVMSTMADELREIRGNPAWRELLRSKYSNPIEYDDIRTLLGIAQ